MNCPDCNGEMWDNRSTKRNPRQPDFKCKNKDGCGKGVWLKDQQNNGAQNGATPAPAHTSSAASRPLGPLYNECLDFANKACEHYFGKDVAAADVIAAAATLFIQVARDGGTVRAPKPVPVPVAPPPPPVQQYAPLDEVPF